MRIAVLGWGSLVWDPKMLEEHLMSADPGAWVTDGPLLPIEFARVSKDGRLSLVIVEGYRRVQTLWNEMRVNNLSDAIEILRVREGTKVIDNIGYVNLTTGQVGCQHGQPISDTIRTWAKLKEFDAVIWTDLAKKFNHELYGQLSATNVVAYVRSCMIDAERYKLVKTYILKAPNQIQTAYRPSLETAVLADA